MTNGATGRVPCVREVELKAVCRKDDSGCQIRNCNFPTLRGDVLLLMADACGDDNANIHDIDKVMDEGTIMQAIALDVEKTALTYSWWLADVAPSIKPSEALRSSSVAAIEALEAGEGEDKQFSATDHIFASVFVLEHYNDMRKSKMQSLTDPENVAFFRAQSGLY
ncbi:hypothetical protein WJX74_000367 [Apatococcus lobatus]|uniref:Uncharacterized protein n=1 Tax=Apatococcus lobatus TaxID=904363 RepID=A0AAW1QIE5_9CHLO